jgi:putative zinc finger protein
MSTKTKRAKQAREYVCIDPRLGRQVYNYYNDALPENEARRFEEHLLLCFRCQQIVFELDAITEAIKANREHWLKSDEQPKGERGSKHKGKP